MSINIAVLQKNAPRGNTLWMKDPDAYGLKVRQSMTIREMDMDKSGTCYAVKSPLEIYVNDFYDTSKAMHRGKRYVYICRKDFGRMLRASEAVISIPIDMFELLLEEIESLSKDAFQHDESFGSNIYQNSRYRLNRKTGDVTKLPTVGRRHKAYDTDIEVAASVKTVEQLAAEIPMEDKIVSPMTILSKLKLNKFTDEYHATLILSALKLLASLDTSNTICRLMSDPQEPLCTCGAKAEFYGYDVMEQTHMYRCPNPDCQQLMLGVVPLERTAIGDVTVENKTIKNIMAYAFAGSHDGAYTTLLIEQDNGYCLYKGGTLHTVEELLQELLPTIPFYSKKIKSIFDSSSYVSPAQAWVEKLNELRTMPLLHKVGEDLYEDAVKRLQYDGDCKAWTLSDINTVEDVEVTNAYTKLDMLHTLSVNGCDALNAVQQEALFDAIRVLAASLGVAIRPMLNEHITENQIYTYSPMLGKYLLTTAGSERTLFSTNVTRQDRTSTGFGKGVNPMDALSLVIHSLLNENNDVPIGNVALLKYSADDREHYSVIYGKHILSEAQLFLFMAPTLQQYVPEIYLGLGKGTDILTIEQIQQNLFFNADMLRDCAVLSSVDGINYSLGTTKITVTGNTYKVQVLPNPASKEIAVTSVSDTTIADTSEVDAEQTQQTETILDTRTMSTTDFVIFILNQKLTSEQEKLMYSAHDLGINVAPIAHREMTLTQMNDAIALALLT